MGIKKIFKLTDADQDSLVLLFDNGKESVITYSIFASHFKEDKENTFKVLNNLIDQKTNKTVRNLCKVIENIIQENENYILKMTDGSKEDISGDEAKTLRSIVF